MRQNSMDIITRKKCGKQYAYEILETLYSGKERETANCPYCGEVGYSEMTSQNISSNKLDQDGNPIRKKSF